MPSSTTLATLLALSFTPLLAAADPFMMPSDMPKAECNTKADHGSISQASVSHSDAVTAIQSFCKIFPQPDTNYIETYTKNSYFHIQAWPLDERSLDVDPKDCEAMLTNALDGCGAAEGAPDGTGKDDMLVGGLTWVQADGGKVVGNGRSGWHF